MAAINLSSLRSEAVARVRNSAITNAQWNNWSNQSQGEVASKLDLPHLEYRLSLTTTASTREYFIDQFLPGSILSIVDETNDQVLRQENEKALLIRDNDRDDEGAPTHYSLAGTSNVEGQPSAASTIDIVSSSASDTTEKVRVRGLVSGSWDYELITLNGTTTSTGSKSFSEVVQITKDNTTAGAITVTDTTGSTTLCVIPRARYATEYQRLHFHPVPDSTYTLSLRGLRRPLDMINDEDIPDLPELFHELIVIGMQQRAHQHLYDFTRSNELKQLFELKVQELARHGAKKLDYVPYMRGRPFMDRPEIGRLPPEYENF